MKNITVYIKGFVRVCRSAYYLKINFLPQKKKKKTMFPLQLQRQKLFWKVKVVWSKNNKKHNINVLAKCSFQVLRKAEDM